MDHDTFRKLCNFHGIEPILASDAGQRYTPSPEAQKELLTALGINIADEKAEETLHDLQWRRWQQIVDPVKVVPQGSKPLNIEIRLSEELLHLPLQWNLMEEAGASHEGRFLPAEATMLDKAEYNGRKYVSVMFDLIISLPCGYHTLSVMTADNQGKELQGSCKLIITPASCYLPPGLEQETRIWGLSCHLDGIRSRRNWGIGDFSDLRNLVVWGAENGAGTVAVSPLQSMFFRKVDTLVLNRSSLQFFDYLYLDIEAIDDFHESEEARDFVRDPAFQVRLATLRDKMEVNYSEVAEAKLSALELLWQHFCRYHLDPETERGRLFRSFQEAGGDVLYAFGVYQALYFRFYAEEKEQGGSWMNWPEQFQDRCSQEVVDFVRRHKERIEMYLYIQWQAELQLAGVGRRSMELGLKVGLMQSIHANVNAGGFDTWYDRSLFALKMMLGEQDAETGPDGGVCVAPVIPGRQTETAYAFFIRMLRTNMRHAGALRLNTYFLAERQQWIPAGKKPDKGIHIKRNVDVLLGVLALESQRNRCLAICEFAGELPEDFRALLLQKGIFLSMPGQFERNVSGDWSAPGQYPPQSVVSTSGYARPTLAGFWSGKDIVHGPLSDPFRRENAIIARAADRAHLLVTLHREGLLPEGYDVDPAAVPRMTSALAKAVQLFLAGTAAKFFLLQVEDIPVQQEEPPLEVDEYFFFVGRRKVAADIESLRENDDTRSLFRTFCRERGVGVVRPSALLVDRQEKKSATIPRAFYRLQLYSDFTFRQSAEIVPYLKELGVSHCYLSPYLKARPGSPHGYDIIDHSSLNPEIGGREDFELFVSALDRHSMAQILDMVPNHMGVGLDNKWWVDVLENGQTSLYADFFDINWQPQQEELKGRLLLPVLGDHYGSVLEGGELQLCFAPEEGNFSLAYYEHRYPIAPRSYPFILAQDLQRLENRLGAKHDGFLELQSLIASFSSLPDRFETAPEKIEMRHRNKEVLKRLLARLCREFPAIAEYIEENVILFNGEKDHPESFDLLHALLGMQPYRLAFWRVASDEINYRRFFDINDLAGIRMENKRVFEETHRFVLDLIATGKVDGLRIDHPDGLYDPREYCRRLQKAVAEVPIDENEGLGDDHEVKEGIPLPLYVVVEKILADFEYLPTDWLVHGSTGYEFSALVGGLFVDATAEKALTCIYDRFIGERIDFDRLLYNCKKLIIKTAMSGELNVLAGELYRLAKMNRYTQDFTLNGLREALIELVACFPVYRTYITAGEISKTDRDYVERAVARAMARQPAEETSIYNFVKAVLTLEGGKGEDDFSRTARENFVKKLQQYTGPVMAKGLEDTSFYIYNRLLSLNEVGGNPRRFGVSVAAFHHASQERNKRWPNAMLNTSTHDSKRSEDVRSRINVLSEMPAEWQSALDRWSEQNKRYKTRVESGLAPSRNDEYAFYQNLLGAWPLQEMDHEQLALFSARMERCMLKTIREAKIHTSWINPVPAYEAAMTQFVRSIFAEESEFLQDFVNFQKKTSWFGMLNSISQLLLKLASSGVPDIYQGNEIWRFCLVDPDNRRAVDFQKRRNMLEEVKRLATDMQGELAPKARQLLENMADGRIKMWTTWRALAYRSEHADLFEHGAYEPLEVKGEKAEHLCGLARTYGKKAVVAATPRLLASLLEKDSSRLPLGPDVWSDTLIILPDDLAGHSFQNILTGEVVRPEGTEKKALAAAKIFSNFPVALLRKNEQEL